MVNTFSVYLWILVRKILVNRSPFAKFANFPSQNFPMYGINLLYVLVTDVAVRVLESVDFLVLATEN